MSYRPSKIIVCHNADNVLAQQFLDGILRYANDFGSCRIEPVNYTSLRISNIPKDCRGIISVSPPLSLLKDLTALNRPAVFATFAPYPDPLYMMNREWALLGDSRMLGVRAAEFFLTRMPRTFAYVGITRATNWDLQRAEGFAERLREAGHTAHLYPRTKEPLTSDRDADHLQKWLKNLPKPLAVFAANDMRAKDVLEACQKAEITVPYEATVLGVDNNKLICESARPRLSSISFRAEEKGYEVARYLDELVHRRANSKKPLPSLPKTMMPGEVVERESTADQTVANPAVGRGLAFIALRKGLDIRATDVANEVGLKRNWLNTLFQQTLGTSIMDEIAKVRLKTVLHLIRETDTPFHEISRRCGFATPTTLCHLVRKETGKSMRDLRNPHSSP